MEDLKIKVARLEKELEEMKRECCSRKTVEQRTRQIMLLEQVIEKVGALSSITTDMEKKYQSTQKYLYIAIGVFLTLKTVGIDEIVKKILLEGG